MVTDFKKKQKRLTSKTWLMLGGVALLLVCLILAISDIKVYQKKRELNAKIEALQKKIQELKTKNIALSSDIGQANDEVYVEKVAREDLGLQKEGEMVVSFVETETTVQKPVEKKGFFEEWFAWLGALFQK